MATATKAPGPSKPSSAKTVERSPVPAGLRLRDWHALRLFGHGRHPASFEAGIERKGELW